MMHSGIAIFLLGLPTPVVTLAPLPQSVPAPCPQTIEADGSFYYYVPPAPPSCNQNCLDVYHPNAPAKGVTILYAHSGGFTGGDKAEVSAKYYCKALADLGYHVVSANYTLAIDTEDPGLATAGFPQAIKDMKAAVAWIRYSPTAAAHGLPDCIVAVGNSAGGTLAALLGTTVNVSDLEPAANVTYGIEEDFHVVAAVTFAATTNFLEAGCNGYQIPPGNPLPCAHWVDCGQDPAWIHPDGTCCELPCNRAPCHQGDVAWCAGYEGEGVTAAEKFLGKHWGTDEEALCGAPTGSNPFVLASAVLHADAGDAPYFGFSAELDSLVPGKQTQLLVDALTLDSVLAGNKFKTWELGCGHGLETLFDGFSCPSLGTTCDGWQPLGDCLGTGCSNPGGRAAFQTMLAIAELGVGCQ